MKIKVFTIHAVWNKFDHIQARIQRTFVITTVFVAKDFAVKLNLLF